MNPTAEQIQKINHFSKVPLDMCKKIASAVELQECQPKKALLTEGDTGDTMVLVFQGQVEVSKNMMVKTASGLATSRKPIIRLETTDPPPKSPPITEPTVFVVEAPAFGIGEFSLVLDDAIRTAHVHATTPVQYGILTLEDFSRIVKDNPEIGGFVYFEVAKAAVQNLATASADISNLTQAFFFALTR
ncbi:MAG: cyclic nucleotide-binding domain-containing protein [Candidatus Marinimicrobia bacterium]|jgi:CRP-like cAMP-binding protein|nr:cyclic nucleotide-binding domain-containing protein [Candidatus Neomarinimicrobiota bacterium]MBT3838450.1 cyclic nucleotide-binding domain-containing protein [Candidatus Neomarinimicrobiota bacterium]MBT3998755.1 cyclic nucleotide-binding domain-containing protein [Candidatus Neomarinimicrobiota bacterium]MBT4283334.1 cyclic nucleotide-binding domain-containing protein [Candidatus Neomarinimicrobiota bacterium]MBT4578353.1 cyclic nucleotide-binding domain-containing protein [Candidatus Neom